MGAIVRGIPIWMAAAFAWAQAVSGPAEATQASPSPPPQEAHALQRPDKADEPGERLHVDVEGHVERLLEERAAAGLPRFEESIEVRGKTPQVMIERFFGGLDVECAPAGVGAPSARELDEARPTPPPTADLLALAQLALAQIKGRDKRADRYFLYGMKRGTEVSYQLRDARVPVTWLYGINGTTFELVDSFPDRDEAIRALRRRERGSSSPAPAPSSVKAALWGPVQCRPRR